MIPPVFGPSAESFLDRQRQSVRHTVIELIVDDICENPYLEPANPESKKRIYQALPAIFTKYIDEAWWVIYQVVTYPRERRLVVQVASIGRAGSRQHL
ncbi:MAG: hypothetical protein IH958_01870 [Chloroflexi bacterium]|nr:hypothetical protein [Chloroflexota bacterium]